MTQPQSQQPNVLDAINGLFAGLEKAQSKGLYSFEESAKLYSSMMITKEFFKQFVEGQKKAQEQQAELAQKMSKLSTIKE